ncbi:TlpA family protein disulfide reductase [Virgibacillus necropolis]|uniref:Cytochrome C biogenesis protein n=1 Tax=Virgibacillus necropolis TaxID=163877 RepID=A0A221MDB0_9BACI|nr:redoxin domain-containing protein [Virgibacillus necropolis]ASN05614.1 cytochrome C biogenesis protein [Virgibacillus necropolis]
MIKKVLAGATLMLLTGLLIINITGNSEKNTGKNEIDVTGDTSVEGVAISSSTKSGLEVGMQAPNFELETLSGETVKLSDLQGKKVFINFWATWCPPCKKEMPEMQKFYEQHSDEVEILAVNVTGQENSLKAVRDFSDNFKYTYPILLDKELKVTEEYMAFGLPTTYFIGTDGVVQQPRKIGPMTFDFMKEMLEKLS